jgi:hypothetical protein
MLREVAASMLFMDSATSLRYAQNDKKDAKFNGRKKNGMACWLKRSFRYTFGFWRKWV